MATLWHWTLQPCPHCKKKITPEEGSCPHCGQPLTNDQSKKAREEKIAGIIGVCLIGGLVGWYAFSGGSDSPKSIEDRAREKLAIVEKDCNDDISAFVYSMQFIKKALKSPSSADFPWSTSSEEVSVRNLGGCTHQVVAWVDAQNSFGAKIRTYYTTIVQYRKTTQDWYHLTPYMAFNQSKEGIVVKASALQIIYENTNAGK